MYDKDNVFAKIARNEIPCEAIVENDYALSFNDINPMFEKHVLIIPKGEYENILDFELRASPKEKEGFLLSVCVVALCNRCMEKKVAYT